MISGIVAPAFAPVRDEFARNFESRGEVGAAVAVLHHGEAVVDLWGGARSVAGAAWERDTLVITYSTAKPFAATCALVLVDRGALELDAPVARYWPEFTASGKAAVTVRQLLSHQAGLIALRQDLPGEALFERETIVAALEREEPWWPPGRAIGEHALFYGHLIDELVRRVDGRSLRRLFAEEIASPWNLDFHLALDPADISRCAEVVGMEESWPGGSAGSAGSVAERALTNPPGALLPEVVNSERWKTAEVPAINGYGTARAIARFYAGILGGGELDGVRVLSQDVCTTATSVQAAGTDVFLDEHAVWGLGFSLEDDYFGHGGLGGSTGYAWRSGDLALAYVTNRLADHDRATAVLERAEACARRADE